MKFGHNLPRNQVPEWAANYINYKGLKKLIKNAAEASKDGSPPDLACMFTTSPTRVRIECCAPVASLRPQRSVVC